MARRREAADVESGDGDIASIAGVIHQHGGVAFGDGEIGAVIGGGKIGQKSVFEAQIIQVHENTSFENVAGGMEMVNTRKLRGKMAEKGYTQRTLAEKMKRNKNTLNAKINGKTPFTDEEIESACEALEIEEAAEVCRIFLPGIKVR